MPRIIALIFGEVGATTRAWRRMFVAVAKRAADFHVHPGRS
jgi:hypothetical protein